MRGCGALRGRARVVALLVSWVAVAACAGARTARPVSPSAASAPVAWTRWIATPRGDAFDAVATAPDGAVYAVGRDAYGAFVARYSASGERAWQHTLHGVDRGLHPALAVDATGAVFVAGGFVDRFRVAETALTSRGSKDVFVARIDARGEVAWARQYGGAHFETALAVATDGDGAAYVTGTYQRATDLDGAVIDNGVEFDAFVAKFDARGAHMWNARFYDEGCLDSRGRALAVAPDGDVYLTGTLCRRVALEGDAAPEGAAERSRPHAFVARLAQGGRVRWLRALPSSERSAGVDLALSPDGRVVVAGVFEGALDLGESPRREARMTDVFVASWSASGTRRWLHALGGAEEDTAPAVAVGRGGEVYLAGGRNGATECDGEAWTGDGGDAYIARFDRAGAAQGHVTFASDTAAAVRGLRVEDDGALIVAGAGGAMRFGGAAHTSRGDSDGFLVRAPAAALGFAALAGPSTLGPDEVAPVPAARSVVPRVAGESSVIRINFSGSEGENFGNIAFEVDAGESHFEGTTNADGVAEFRVPNSSGRATLSVPSRGISYPVLVGTLDPIDDPSGQEGRLRNLGYEGFFGDREGPTGLAAREDALRRELEFFQRDQHLPSTGTIDAATLRALRRAHGS